MNRYAVIRQANDSKKQLLLISWGSISTHYLNGKPLQPALLLIAAGILFERSPV